MESHKSNFLLPMRFIALDKCYSLVSVTCACFMWSQVSVASNMYNFIHSKYLCLDQHKVSPGYFRQLQNNLFKLLVLNNAYTVLLGVHFSS